MHQIQAAKKRAELEAAAIRILGAQGPYADVINGLFVRMDDEGDEPVWRQRNGDRCLYCWSSQQWWVSNTKDKDARSDHGWARSEVIGPSLLPTESCTWKVQLDANVWEEQQLQVH